MDGERRQGRPPTGGREVGRDKIIARLQAVIQTRADLDLSRKHLSEYAGVTPALISYYFPKRETLLLEIVRPIVASYAERMEYILSQDLEEDVKLHDVVALLLNLYMVDGKSLDLYYDVSRKLGEAVPFELARMTSMLSAHFSRPNTSIEHDFHAAVLQGAVWGMCRFAAKAEAHHEATSEDKISRLATQVINILVSGISPVP